MTRQRDYENGAVSVRPGDTVIDCGAHVGVFTRYALKQGASQVVAIEPEPGNLLCLEANLAEEIVQGKVRLVKAGVWNQRSTLTMLTNPDNSGAHTFVETSQTASSWKLPVLPLDDVVAELGLESVDFIKMDIEGSERQAVEGAQQTIHRFGPRMAICSYHTPGDPTEIPQIVGRARPGYHVEGKDVEVRQGSVVTKVLYFH
jgi:FkbM family methyltransferase